MIKDMVMYRVKTNPIQDMQIKAEVRLNPHNCYLSCEAKKRLRWMYVYYYECEENATVAAKKLGLTREWLTKVKNKFENHRKDPRSLEPESKAPHNTDNRERIDKDIETLIIKIRNLYPYWGKEKIATISKRDYKVIVSSSTVGRYLAKHKLQNVKLSEKNKAAWRRKSETTARKLKCRPPSQIKDYKPGALVEKDMKFVLKMGGFINPQKYKAKENFRYQFTVLDSFTRIKANEIEDDSDSKTAVKAFESATARLPFAIACMNTDSGSENWGDFDQHLEKKDIFHFFSRTGTPTDNPRVERSHLTDDIEFYSQGNIFKGLDKQKEALSKQDYTYNYIRPHQALSYLTPMEFYRLWKRDPKATYKIVDTYKDYLKRQSKRLASSRRLRRKDQIEKLMLFIDAKLTN